MSTSESGWFCWPQPRRSVGLGRRSRCPSRSQRQPSDSESVALAVWASAGLGLGGWQSGPCHSPARIQSQRHL